MTASEQSLHMTQVAAQAAADKLGRDLVAFDVSDQLAITDVFLVITGASDRQVGAIVDEITEKMREELGVSPARREGDRENRWVLLDYLDIVVHVQHEEEREHYALERLWRDCPQLELTVDAGEAGAEGE